MSGHGGGGRAARRGGMWNRRYTRWRPRPIRLKPLTVEEALARYPRIRWVGKMMPYGAT